MNHTSPCSTTVKSGKGSSARSLRGIVGTVHGARLSQYISFVRHEDQCMFCSISDSSDQFYVYILQRKLQHDYRHICDVE